jgi:hypothetical protein
VQKDMEITALGAAALGLIAGLRQLPAREQPNFVCNNIVEKTITREKP